MQLTVDGRERDGRVVTPRIGKPVEVQALWLNALAGSAAERRAAPRRGASSAACKPSSAILERCGRPPHDVVDADHVAGKVDASMRPNQIFAVGGLPHAVLHGERARRGWSTRSRRELLTPIGLRSLAPDDRRLPRHTTKAMGSA